MCLFILDSQGGAMPPLTGPGGGGIAPVAPPFGRHWIQCQFDCISFIKIAYHEYMQSELDSDTNGKDDDYSGNSTQLYTWKRRLR